jgi:plastocyanin domain-containing protein
MSTRSIRTVLVAALTVVAALAVVACTQAGDAKATPAAGTSGTAAPAAPALEGRRVDITAGAEGYSPSTIEAKKGESLVLRFTRTTKSDCLAQVVFPGLKITKDLPLNTPVEIAIKADQPGQIPFQCGMAMVHGNVNVGDG